MWAPRLLSYCDPISVRGGGHSPEANHRNTEAFLYLFPAASPFTGYISTLCSAFHPEGPARWLGQRWCVSAVENTEECRVIGSWNRGWLLAVMF